MNPHEFRPSEQVSFRSNNETVVLNVLGWRATDDTFSVRYGADSFLIEVDIDVGLLDGDDSAQIRDRVDVSVREYAETAYQDQAS